MPIMSNAYAYNLYVKAMGTKKKTPGDIMGEKCDGHQLLG